LNPLTVVEAVEKLSEAAGGAVWERTDGGNPLASTLFAGRARDTDPEELALNMSTPSSADNLDAWVALTHDALSAEAKSAAKAIAFAYEPAAIEVLAELVPELDVEAAVAELTARFLVTSNAGRFEMHSAVRQFIGARTSDAEQAALAARLTDFYQSKARTVFLDGIGEDEPSYGTLDLESFPDYFADTARHLRFVDDLLERLADNGYPLARDDGILVLDSGDGTHDPGFAKHGLDITDLVPHERRNCSMFRAWRAE